jgi:hypothetical protein
MSEAITSTSASITSPTQLAPQSVLPRTALARALGDARFVLEASGARAEAERWLAAVDRLDAVPPGRGRLAAAQREAAGLGVSVSTLNNRLTAWRKSGQDWATFIDRRRYPVPGARGLPPAFVEFCRTLTSEFQREQSLKRAHVALLARLEQWRRTRDPKDAIPGYSEPPPRMRSTGLPEGWHYRNFARIAQPSKYARALTRTGEKAAAEFLPANRTTRVGIEPGMIYTLDDQHYDVHVSFVGLGTAALMRPAGFDASDFASDFTVASMAKPRITREDGTVENLNETDFAWFVLHLLADIGLHPGGTTLEVEHGTAAIRGEFRDRLQSVLDGRLKIATGGKYGQSPAIAGLGHRAAVSGNFKFKARRESAFNLLRNAMAALPGATGLDRHRAPEETAGIERYHRQYVKLLETLPLDRATLLRAPVLPWHTFAALNHEIRGQIMAATDHACEGWEKAGYVATEITIDGQTWLSAQKLDDLRAQDATKAAALEALAALPGHSRIRRLSRAEVWQRHRPRLQTIPDYIWPLLLPDKMATELRVGKSLEFVHTDRLIDTDPLVYIATARDEHGRKITLQRGEVYRCFLSPLNPSKMVVCEASGTRRGAFLGTVDRFHVPSRDDHERIWANQGQINSLRADEKGIIELRSRGKIAHRQANFDANRQLADLGTARTPREKADLAALTETEDAVFAATPSLPDLPPGPSAYDF